MPPDFKAELNAALADACRAVAPDATVSPAVARPKNRQMGDFASPVAMQLARVLKKSPRDIASQILRQWTPPDFVASAEAAGAGYVNIHLRPQAKTRIVRDILNNPKNFGRGADQDEFILLEFVSANPTGPLHVGHGRGAAYGDSLARILRHAGFPAAAEYYLNDAGLQMSVLAASVWLRHAHPDDWDEMPKGAYRGTYLRQAAAHLREWLAANAPDLRPAPLLEKIAAQEDEDAAANLLADSVRRAFGENQFAEFKIKVRDFMTRHFLEADLRAMGVRFDRWFSENDDLRAVGKIESALEKLGRVAPDSLYEKDGALWFRAGAFGDEKDRVARRSNGEFTYFAADIAYCEDKFSRPTPGGGGGVRAIYVLGADHHGYAPRLRAAARALGRDPARLETPLIQFVALKRADELIPMSTRAGRFVSLRELLDAVGRDAARFFFVSRKNDQRLDFDLQAAVAQNPDNPVYYLQYARARAAGVLRKMAEGEGADGPPDLAARATDEVLAALELDGEMALCEMLGAFGETVSHAAEARAPHLLANWLRELAGIFHAYYTKVPALSAPEPQRTARAALLAATGEVAALGLELLGVSAPERMTREEEGEEG